jgi:hypothetical protein
VYLGIMSLEISQRALGHFMPRSKAEIGFR